MIKEQFSFTWNDVLNIDSLFFTSGLLTASAEPIQRIYLGQFLSLRKKYYERKFFYIFVEITALIKGLVIKQKKLVSLKQFIYLFMKLAKDISLLLLRDFIYAHILMPLVLRFTLKNYTCVYLSLFCVVLMQVYRGQNFFYYYKY